jgi:excisionase family DNA binding protein
MATTLQTNEFYTTKELAGMLRVTQTTVYRMARRGELPYYSIGRSMRFRQCDVDDFLKRCREVGGLASGNDASGSHDA